MWQQSLRERQPLTLIFWGQGDIFFTPAGGEAYLRDLPDAELVRLDSGHFAVEDNLDRIAEGITMFYDTRVHPAVPPPSTVAPDAAGENIVPIEHGNPPCVIARWPVRPQPDITTRREEGMHMDDVRVAQLWRYPVKSLRGEALDEADLTADGVAGDRVVHVSGSRRPLTGRTRHGLLTIAATTGSDGRPRIAGEPWDSPAALARVREHAGPEARLVEDRTPARFDILNLLVATDGAVDTFGHDVRRLRPNLVLSGIPAHLEPRLEGRALAVGNVLIGLHSVRQRCVVTSIDPDSGTQDLDVFRRIRTVFGGKLALNSWVIRPGLVHIDEPVPHRPSANWAHPGSAGGSSAHPTRATLAELPVVQRRHCPWLDWTARCTKHPCRHQSSVSSVSSTCLNPRPYWTRSASAWSRLCQQNRVFRW